MAENMEFTLQEQAREAAAELPGAELTYPFGEEWDVYKVRGKVFMLLTEVTGQPMVILKVDPAESQLLQQTYEGIVPGYHMNKKHWVSLLPGKDVPGRLVGELVLESYLLVIEQSVPKRDWPVNPHTYARSQG
ncbi:MAG: MmcQ/YjbR family DNA-binding protein [Rothia sp. (in: high G+C Gram-positive bacteria)]|nr:MmcQ/YjbR family DNA-binding protein [Rothia sp. (in: high G+C Gram-positive bacteria)]